MIVCACGRNTNGERSICDRCTAFVLFGLTRDATPAEIKEAYRVLAKVWHPDRFEGDERLKLLAEEKLKEINSAYQLLTTTPAVGPRTRSTRPSRQPEQPPQARSSPDGERNQEPRVNFASPLRRNRHVSSKRVMIVVAALIVVGLGVYTWREHPAVWESVSTAITEGLGGRRPASLVTDQLPAPSTVQSAPSNQKTEAAAKPALPPPVHVKAKAVAAEGPSLLLYPDNDPRVPYFTVGSTKNDVLRVQGPPTKATSKVLVYGPSEVYFQDGRVQSWHSDPRSPLKARMPDE